VNEEPAVVVLFVEELLLLFRSVISEDVVAFAAKLESPDGSELLPLIIAVVLLFPPLLVADSAVGVNPIYPDAVLAGVVAVAAVAEIPSDDTDGANKFVGSDVVASPLLLLLLLLVVPLAAGLETTVMVLATACDTDGADEAVVMLEAVVLPLLLTDASAETKRIVVVVVAVASA